MEDCLSPGVLLIIVPRVIEILPSHITSGHRFQRLQCGDLDLGVCVYVYTHTYAYMQVWLGIRQRD